MSWSPRHIVAANLVVAGLLVGDSARVSGQQGLGQIVDRVRTFADAVEFTPAEELAIGRAISQRLAARYGVVQNEAIHRYVSLVGSLLADADGFDRSGLSWPDSWTFVVLDAQGVNAFAAPGGYVHVTLGALKFFDSEAELAGVLGHEMAHVLKRHTISELRNAGLLRAASAQVGNNLVQAAINLGYDKVIENAWGREQEMEADAIGVRLANGARYSPHGLAGYLEHLIIRNADRTTPSGPFSTHPMMRERLGSLRELIAGEPLQATVSMPARLEQLRRDQAAVFTAAPTVAGPRAAGAGNSLMDVPNNLRSTGSAPTTVDAANARNANPERDSAHGSNPRGVQVRLDPAEIARFRAAFQAPAPSVPASPPAADRSAPGGAAPGGATAAPGRGGAAPAPPSGAAPGPATRAETCARLIARAATGTVTDEDRAYIAHYCGPN